jgi:acyl-CoA thioester hydrolase
MVDSPSCIEIPVAWGDMDAFGHVNNTVYLRWFESARIAFFQHVRIPHRDVEQTEAPILAHTRCTFELPLTYPDTVRVPCSIGRVGTKSFTMLYEIHSEAHGKRAAHGDGVIVWYDYASGATSPLPDPLRERLAAHRVP